jgi:simple sugar transport system permease protein
MAAEAARGTGAGVLRRLQPSLSAATAAAAILVGIVVALGLSSILISATGGSPIDSVHALYNGSMADSAGWSTTLLNTAPLLLVAVGSCVSSRSGTYNIGQEVQVMIGAFAAACVTMRMAVHGPTAVVLSLIAAAAAGGLWAGLSAVMLKLRGVNVVVSTLLMTFLAQQLVAYSVSNRWFLQETAEGSGIANPESNQVPPDALLHTYGQYPDLQLNIGLFIALAAAVLIAIALTRTRWGFRIKLVGLNPLAARHAGVRVALLGGTALAISGAFAGLAGSVLLTSPIGTNRLSPDLSSNVGWDGLLVALVARNRPLVAAPVALLFGVLRAGGNFLAATGVPSYVVDVTKALLVLAFVAPPVLVDEITQRRRGVTVPPPTTAQPVPSPVDVAA